MTNVLYVHGGALLYGGTEAYMMNFFRRFDPDRVRVDFAVHGDEPGVYDAEVRRLGGRIFILPVKSRDYRGNVRALKALLREGAYDAVHAHTDANNAHVLGIAKACGVPLRISHSHNTSTQTSSRLKRWYNALEKRRIPRVATHLFACSDLAGQWLYGRHPFQIINNAIDTARFVFNADRRRETRAALGLSDEIVLGHIGRFAPQKNHPKLISLFKAFRQRHPDAVLLLIGDGEDKAAVQQRCAQEGLSGAVRFLAPTPDIPAYLSAMDAFVLPSLFEGLPVVLVEAQAAGLPCVVSSTVSEKARLTDLVEFVGLDDEDDTWCTAIERALQKPRTDRRAALVEAGFDIETAAKRLENFYVTGVY